MTGHRSLYWKEVFLVLAVLGREAQTILNFLHASTGMWQLFVCFGAAIAVYPEWSPVCKSFEVCTSSSCFVSISVPKKSQQTCGKNDLLNHFQVNIWTKFRLYYRLYSIIYRWQISWLQPLHKTKGQLETKSKSLDAGTMAKLEEFRSAWARRNVQRTTGFVWILLKWLLCIVQMMLIILYSMLI